MRYNNFTLSKATLTKLLGLLLLVAIFSCTIAATSTQAQSHSHVNKLMGKRYDIAKAYYHQLQASATLAKSRQNWLYCSNSFEKTYQTAPRDKLAPGSLLTLGDIYYKMYKRFANPEDLDKSLDSYQKVYTLFPKHSFADDALYLSGKILALEKKEYQRASLLFAKLLAVYPSGDMISRAASDLKKFRRLVPATQETVIIPKTPQNKEIIEVWQPPPTPKNSTTQLSQVTNIRHWSTKAYTRVVVEASQPVKFSENLLKQNGLNPRRLYLNLYNSKISDPMPSSITIDDGLLKQVRSGQFSPDTVRVVLDTQSLSSYNIFSLQDPFRIVIDIKGAEPQTPSPAKIVVPNTPSLAQQLGLGIKRIIIDPGHGGKDPGAIGINGLREKDIVLKVATLVAKRIKLKIGSEVLLTRDRDIFVPLEERTAIANTKDGDLFISIHANSAPNKKAHGVETYYLSMASTKEERQVAALENSTSNNKISDLQDILKMMQVSKIEESARLAKIIQENMINGLSKKYKNIGDHGVKKAPFVVLIGAQMPAILSEIAFMSNKTDAKRLKSDAYLNDVANQITEGIIEYTQALSMASL